MYIHNNYINTQTLIAGISKSPYLPWAITSHEANKSHNQYNLVVYNLSIIGQCQLIIPPAVSQVYLK